MKKSYGLNYIDMAGLKIGSWTVIGRVKSASKHAKFVCQCECGRKRDVFGKNLRRGFSSSCRSCSKKLEGFNESIQFIRNTSEYKKWRREILARDRFTCQLCGETEKLHVHHIIPFIDLARNGDNEMMYNTDNGVVLCTNCHKDVHDRSEL